MGLKANTIPKDELDLVLRRLSDLRQVDFTCYKRSTLARRVEQRMRVRKCGSAADYCALLERDGAEVEALVSALLIKVTSFFRDPPVWEEIRRGVLPQIVEQAGPDGEIRVWSAGCATGEEAYSIAILLSELSGRHGFTFRVFGTDRDADAIAAAGRGRFSRHQVSALSAEMRQRWFERAGDDYVVRRELRRAVVFGVHDLVADAPISRLDLILCRNLFIYLDAAGQRRLLPHLYQALKPERAIVLGRSELMPLSEGLFGAVHLPLRIYRKTAAAHPLQLFGHRIQPLQETQSRRLFAAASEETWAAALNAVDGAVVVLDKDGVVKLWNHGAARLYGKVGSEVAGRPLAQLKLDGLAGERLLERARGALSGGAEEVFTVDGASPRTFRLTVRPLNTGDGEAGGVICIASDVTEIHQARERIRLAEERLQDADTSYRETIAEIQSFSQELGTMNEELRSANQELQTTNAELQSANEELEAANEELRLTNVELQAVNAQLGARTAELERANLLQQAIMGGGAIAVIGVDEDGRINLCNPGAARLFNRSEEQMLRHSAQRLSLAPLPAPVVSRIKRCLKEGLPLSVEAFDCAAAAGKIELSCRLTHLSNGAGAHGAVLIIEPAHGLQRAVR